MGFEEHRVLNRLRFYVEVGVIITQMLFELGRKLKSELAFGALEGRHTSRLALVRPPLSSLPCSP
jgi:hypothetical protein